MYFNFVTTNHLSFHILTYKKYRFDGTGENTIVSNYFTQYKESKIKKISNHTNLENKTYINKQNKLYKKYVNILYP